MQTVQALFEQAQASYDPNQLLQLLALHPYHVEALHAASDLYRLDRTPLEQCANQKIMGFDSNRICSPADDVGCLMPQ